MLCVRHVLIFSLCLVTGQGERIQIGDGRCDSYTMVNLLYKLSMPSLLNLYTSIGEYYASYLGHKYSTKSHLNAGTMPQGLSPRSPNVAKYNDDVRRRLANSFRAAKKSVGRTLPDVDLLILRRRRIPSLPTSTRPRSSERRLCRLSLKGKLERGLKDKSGGFVDNGCPDQLYRVVSEGQWSGDNDGCNGAAFWASDALYSFCKGRSFDLSVQD